MGTKALSMDAELGISKWAIAALVAAMIVVGTMGLVFRHRGPGSDRPTERTPASAPRAVALALGRRLGQQVVEVQVAEERQMHGRCRRAGHSSNGRSQHSSRSLPSGSLM